jgi:elongation factor G
LRVNKHSALTAVSFTEYAPLDVNHGDTVTDFLPMERDRKITIQSAAISFHWPLLEESHHGKPSHVINLIDTPGHQDFRFEVDRCMPILDGAICILDSVKGVEAHTERVWATAQQYRIPRIVYVNKLDRDGASFKKSVLDIASRLNAWPLVCQIPLWENDEFVGVVDVLSRTGFRWHGTKRSAVSESALRNNNSLWEEMQTARLRLVEKLCEDDDDLVEDFAEHGPDLPAEAIRKSIQKAILSGDGRYAPIFAGSSFTNRGVEPLLDAVVDYLPSPIEAAAKSSAMSESSDDTQKASCGLSSQKSKPQPKKAKDADLGGIATVFKVVNDPNIFPDVRGMITFVRIKSGTLYSNSQLSNIDLGSSAELEKPARLLQVSASKVSQIPHLMTGQIGAVVGLKNARTGDTLVAWPGNTRLQRTPDWVLSSVQRQNLSIPPAVAFLSLEPLTLTEGKILEEALSKLSREDPSLRWNKDDKSGIYTLSGMGKLHLEVAMDRLKTNYKIRATFSEIQVDYKEGLTAATVEHRVMFDKVVANKAGKAACTASLEPFTVHEQKQFLRHGQEHEGNIYAIKFSNVPKTFNDDEDLLKEQLYNGAIASMARGPRMKFPLHNCLVRLSFDLATDYFGAGNDAHVVQASLHAVREALGAAHSQGLVSIFEPVMSVNILTPEDAAGAIQRDISAARGGHVLEVKDANADYSIGDIDIDQVYAPPDPYETVQSLREAQKGLTRMLELVAKVPLKEMLDYDASLRSMTAGRHSFTMKLDSFERVVGPREKCI